MWICNGCRKPNADDFEICMYCGCLKGESQAPVPDETVPAQPQTPAQPRKSAQPQKPKSGKKGAAAIIVVLAAALLLSGISFSAHSKAKTAFENGDYAQAVERAKGDFLFGGKLLLEAQEALSREYISQGEYDDAFDAIRDIKKTDLRFDMLAELGDAQLEAGLYEDAFDSYTAMSEDSRGVEGMNRVLLCQAREAALQGNYSEAEDLLERMDGEQFALLNAAEVYNIIAFGKGRDCLLAGDFEGAADKFAEASGYGCAAEALEAAKCIPEGRSYYDMAIAAKGSTGNGEGQISYDDWMQVFNNLVEDSLSLDLYVRMDAYAARSAYAADRSAPNDGDIFAMEDCFSLGLIPKGVGSAMDPEWTSVIDKDTLSSAGSAPDGKILIVWQVKNYSTKQKEYGIAWDLMEYLPQACYPRDLASVEYVVRIAYDYQGDGYYTVDGETVAALREYAKIYAEKAGFGKQAYAGSTVWGDEAPNTIYTSWISWVDGGGFVTGGDPDTEQMAKTTIAAINAAIEKLA